MNIGTNIWSRARRAWVYRDEPEHARVLAELYWRFLIVFTVLIVAGFSVYGGYLFFSARSLEKEEVLLSGAGIVPFNKAELRTMLEGFAERERRYEALKSEPPQIADPSR